MPKPWEWVMDTDPWWKKLLAKAFRRPIWHQVGFIEKERDG